MFQNLQNPSADLTINCGSDTFRVVAREKIRQRREITEDPAFREKLRREDDTVLFDFLAVM